jgi:predicted kinase
MKMRVLMNQKKDFIIDRTNLTKKSRKPLIEALRHEGYRVECVWFKPAETQAQMDELERRIAIRHDQSVPFGILMKMYQSFEIPTKDEGFDKIWSPVEFGY